MGILIIPLTVHLIEFDSDSCSSSEVQESRDFLI